MTDLLSFPFRIDPHSGTAAKTTVGSDQEAAEAIAMLVLTELGERELCPGFGIPDPTTGDVDVANEVQAGLTLWGPDGVQVSLERVELDADTGVADIAVAFTVEGETA